MPKQTQQIELILKAIGVSSPYLAVIIGVFVINNGFLAVLFYHLILLAVVVIIKKSSIIPLLLNGFKPWLALLLCLGGVLPGIVIFTCWPIAAREGSDPIKTLSMLNLGQNIFLTFAIYACLINPLLEESFWRGCFKNQARWPNGVDVLFAGYHALSVFPVLKPFFVLFVFAAMIFVGWLFRNIYRLTKGLIIPLITHIIADITILYAIWQIMQ